MQLSIQREDKPNAVLFRMSGHFTFHDNPLFRQVMDTITSASYPEVMLDVAGIGFMDSAGLGMLLLAREEARKTGHTRLTVSGANGQVHKLFEITRFYEM